MKCPICGKTTRSMLCPECGFDSSREYGCYPTFAPLGNVLSASALREKYEKRQQPENIPAPSIIPAEEEQPLRKRKWPWVAAAACAAALILGIWIGTVLGNNSPSGAGAPSLPSVLLHPQSQQHAHVPQFHDTSNTHD